MSTTLHSSALKRASWSWPLRVVAIAAVITSLAGCQVVLNSNLNEQEANEIVNTLAPEGLKAVKEPVGEKGWQVMVDESDLAAALEVLRANELPGDRYVSMGDIFQKQGLVSTPSEERMRYIYSVSQELSYTLRKIDGVVAARVHVVIPVNDPLNDKLKPSSAAVFIKHRPDVDLRLLVPAVKDFVAHSIEGLTHEGVSLSLFEARPGNPKTGAVAQRRGDSFMGIRTQTWINSFGMLVALAIAAAIVPGVLRRRGFDWRSMSRVEPAQVAKTRRATAP